ncbi:hypothetical protein JTB14_015842 [Gonioctena quinquepunctata]|nr:hypothetical protein JTB14_015842 [Gonioctena quinquepunctata]
MLHTQNYKHALPCEPALYLTHNTEKANWERERAASVKRERIKFKLGKFRATAGQRRIRKIGQNARRKKTQVRRAHATARFSKDRLRYILANKRKKETIDNRDARRRSSWRGEGKMQVHVRAEWGRTCCTPQYDVSTVVIPTTIHTTHYCKILKQSQRANIQTCNFNIEQNTAGTMAKKHRSHFLR